MINPRERNQSMHDTRQANHYFDIYRKMAEFVKANYVNFGRIDIQIIDEELKFSSFSFIKDDYIGIVLTYADYNTGDIVRVRQERSSKGSTRLTKASIGRIKINEYLAIPNRLSVKFTKEQIAMM